MGKEIDIIGNSIAESKIHFVLNTALWESFDASIKSTLHSISAWSEVKFLDENGNLNNSIMSLPNNAGGIYLFVAKPNLIPDSHYYLLYVGRAHSTATQNLRKRCREYIKELNENKRPKIHRMLSGWGEYLYIRYLPLNDNNEIDRIEAELINKILPPFNDQIPDKEIRDAVKAFSA